MDILSVGQLNWCALSIFIFECYVMAEYGYNFSFSLKFWSLLSKVLIFDYLAFYLFDSIPPLSVVGLTEEQAIEQANGELLVFTSSFNPMKNTISGYECQKLKVH